MLSKTSLRARSPIWASEESRARALERATEPVKNTLSQNITQLCYVLKYFKILFGSFVYLFICERPRQPPKHNEKEIIL